VNLLLDTHVLLWVLASPRKLPGEALDAIHRANAVFFSPVNLWEIGIKSSIWPQYGISRVEDIHAGALRANLRELPVRSADTMLSTVLPPIHRDPIDRILMAQSHNNQCHLLTVDRKIALYAMPYVLLAGAVS
jgi:PIN domain nuclease of toxin-antitoxin system